eukprot:3071428-Rhodomonas_salina.1
MSYVLPTRCRVLSYVLPTRCRVLTQRHYAMSDADIGYGDAMYGTEILDGYLMSGTEIGTAYGMSGTDIGYGGTRWRLFRHTLRICPSIRYTFHSPQSNALDCSFRTLCTASVGVGV